MDGDQGGVTIEGVTAPPPAAPRRQPVDTARLARLALLAPTLVITVVCFIVPLGLIALYSFGSVNQVDFNVYFGWTTGNYRAFTSSLYLNTLARSVILSVSTTLACAVIGFTFAYFISRQSPRAQRLLLVAVIAIVGSSRPSRASRPESNRRSPGARGVGAVTCSMATPP